MINKLECSKDIKHEYCCTIVRVGECFPIEGADRIQRTVVNGLDLIVSKTVKEGDIMIYAANETELNKDFLAVNNLYSIDNYMLNKDYFKIGQLLKTNPEEAKQLCGFFTAKRRVRILKLKGIYSFGFLFPIEFLINWDRRLADFVFENNIGKDFDLVNGELFIKPYIPDNIKTYINQSKVSKDHKLNRLVDDSNFKFHYETQQLQRNINKIAPIDTVTITVKIHGTSAIFGKVTCKVPKKLSIFARTWNKVVNTLKLPRLLISNWELGQDTICASRTRIKNSYIDIVENKIIQPNDLWTKYHDILASYLPENTIVYGEIFGYSQSNKFIQKQYDYNLPSNESRFMPYRIVAKDIHGTSYEWEVEEVYRWTTQMMELYPELRNVLYPIQILYHGKLTDLYPKVKNDLKWNENILECLKSDKKFGLEQNEPLCKNKVPREGICIRIDKDPINQTFKLKSSKFLDRESKAIDNNEVDIEMQETCN